MNALKVRRRVESETLHLPELRPFFGKEVEIIVLETERKDDPGENDRKRSLQGSVLRYDDPFDSVAEGDWEAQR